MGAIAKAGYEKPSGIQAQAWPILLSGADRRELCPKYYPCVVYVLDITNHFRQKRALSPVPQYPQAQ
eukprot:SAG11_NODE_4461_length_1887_cov_3.988814_2_plen_67_part_00